MTIEKKKGLFDLILGNDYNANPSKVPNVFGKYDGPGGIQSTATPSKVYYTTSRGPKFEGTGVE